MRAKFLILLSFIWLMACEEGNVTLDNARQEAVSFVIDGESYELGAGERKSISLETGSHSAQIGIKNGEELAKQDFEVKEGGVLHSGGTPYLLWRQLYGLQKNRKDLLNEAWLKMDSVKVYGDFKVYPEDFHYIEKVWDYGLEDPLPESKTLYVTSDFTIESKIFRREELIEAYRSLAEKSE